MSDITLQSELAAYFVSAAKTDLLAKKSLAPITLGLAGETGQAVSAAKKVVRDSLPDSVYRASCIEELGDVLWYLSAAARRLDMDPSNLQGIRNAADAISIPDSAVHAKNEGTSSLAETPLLELVFYTGQFCEPNITSLKAKERLERLSLAYFRVLQIANLSILSVARANLCKIEDYFGPPEWSKFPKLSRSAPDERIPENLKVRFVKRSSGKTHIMISDVFVGDPLDDNVADEDFYRLHDVFHLANAFVLGWSPVIRALLKRKRKSDSIIDSTEDSGRAIVAEEAIVSYIFAQAKRYGWFIDRDRIPLDILKIVRVLSSGYESENIPLWAWNNCFLQGFHAFLNLKKAGGSGALICDHKQRTIEFQT